MCFVVAVEGTFKGNVSPLLAVCDLNAWKFGSPGAAEGRVAGAVVDSDECLIFTPNFGQNMKFFPKKNPQEEQNETLELEEAMMFSISRI